MLTWDRLQFTPFSRGEDHIPGTMALGCCDSAIVVCETHPELSLSGARLPQTVDVIWAERVSAERVRERISAIASALWFVDHDVVASGPLADELRAEGKPRTIAITSTTGDEQTRLSTSGANRSEDWRLGASVAPRSLSALILAGRIRAIEGLSELPQLRRETHELIGRERFDALGPLVTALALCAWRLAFKKPELRSGTTLEGS